MKFSLSQDFPAGLDRLWDAFGRPEYPEQKYRALGSTAIRMLRFYASADRIEVELERDAPVYRETIPAWARRFLQSRQTMRHRTRWRRIGPALVDAELDITAVGRPVSAHGTGAVVELAPGRTRMTLDFAVESALPVLGDRAARLYAEQIQAALRADHAFTLRYLEAMSHGSP